MSDRPTLIEDEIEVTPEMIEAGIKAASCAVALPLTDEELATALEAAFGAMLRARRSSVVEDS